MTINLDDRRQHSSSSRDFYSRYHRCGCILSLNTTLGSASQITHCEFKFHKVCARLMLRMFTASDNSLGFEAPKQPPYSPDLDPSDFNLFGLLNEALRGCRFDSDIDIRDAVQK
ncbi:hypothetical protein TNIN_174911 [Trichonephila inaurata madagascariensis]|uniref:Uncharacterized protein n=1 Tax=Trichonephila inaurata madagascariensis TaxID=2747483 RepID=A0A8X6XCM0_9ARAC|nr:hypothetical protein TNIN_174911 [Trichonephila inaurata madagascariensis]